jgi:hypothetical protein
MNADPSRPHLLLSTVSGVSRVCQESSRLPAETARRRVAEGTRTPDHRDHNPGLYQLSYRHRAERQS